ncbi:MAG: secondary thiamine-phosphate synthase enzyme YjbQ [bacterium]|nr:secondary thiamine-phosphate synthase enzyme YjbQ [bacterium]
MHKISLSTGSRSQFLDITDRVQEIISREKVKDGLALVWVPHTTAGLTVNENADPDVVRDILASLDKRFPWDDNYAHTEGNSAAHIKSSLMGCAQTLIVKDGRLALGTWQGLYFCEFDGPRKREVWVKFVEG